MRWSELPEVADWLRHAAQDWQTQALLRPHGLYDVAAYHCQQAAEKWLKATVVAGGGIPEFTHNLRKILLAARAAGARLEGLDADAELLMPLASMTRYPGFGDLSLADLGACRSIPTRS